MPQKFRDGPLFNTAAKQAEIIREISKKVDAVVEWLAVVINHFQPRSTALNPGENIKTGRLVDG
jgi:hypothetical protein